MTDFTILDADSLEVDMGSSKLETTLPQFKRLEASVAGTSNIVIDISGIRDAAAPQAIDYDRILVDHDFDVITDHEGNVLIQGVI